MSTALPELRALIDATPFVDTHEHLVEEATRLAGPGHHRLQPCDDFALLFSHYAADDLRSAGMPAADLARFFAAEGIEPAEKWRLVEPFWQRCRHTGYVKAVTLAARTLFGEQGWDVGAAERVSASMRSQVRPGYYANVLQRAGIRACQVNSLEDGLFCHTQYPDLLHQDLSLIPLSTGLNIPLLRERSGLRVETLGDWHGVLDWTFEQHAPRAVAVKSQAAYSRRLNYDDVTAAEATPLFARLVAGESLSPADRKALEDHLLRECIRRAERYRLPVKLHCGYYAGTGRMPLERVRQNAGDLCPLLADFPETRFVLMHIGYPYQDEYIALAKQYPNVWIDLCWAWIINPAACVRFVKEFLLCAPASKLLTFGGDYAVVEPIAGHAAIARQGLAQALSELVAEEWMGADDALALVPSLMHGNAEALFGAASAAAAPAAI